MYVCTIFTVGTLKTCLCIVKNKPCCVFPEITVSDRAKYEFVASLPVHCESEETLNEIKKEIHKRAAEMTSGIHCLQAGTCTLQDPLIQGCDWSSSTATGPRRVKRDSSDTVNITVAITYHGDITTTTGG